MEKTIVFCECNSFECTKTIELPAEEAQAILLLGDVFVIVDDCEIGPSPTDILHEAREGYTLYRSM